MKISMKISEKVPTRTILEYFEKGLTTKFKERMINVEAPDLRDKIRSQLFRASERVTGHRYYTRTLEESIKVLVTDDKIPSYFSTTVGVDLNTPVPNIKNYIEGEYNRRQYERERRKIQKDKKTKVGAKTRGNSKGAKTVGDYATVVEQGRGRMPAAYKYVENGFDEWRRGFEQRIGSYLSQVVKDPRLKGPGYRNIATGQIAKAP